MTLYLKVLMSKVGSCDFGGAIRVADNWGRFDNNRYKNQLRSYDFIRAVRVAVIKTIGVADNWDRFDDNWCGDQLLNWGQPRILYEKKDIMISR